MRTNKVGLPLRKPDLTIEENWTPWLRSLARLYMAFGIFCGFVLGALTASWCIFLFLK